STEALLAIAAARRPAGRPHLETFSPLYLTNECDAECLMCGMRRTNDELVRETAEAATAEAQLDILHRRGLRAVALLTGEYHHGPYRRTMIARTAAAHGWLCRLAHVGPLRRRGMEAYVSLPRLRKASGTPYPAGVSDDLFCRVVAVLSMGLSEAKVVISTREPPAMQRRLLPVIGVLTPGSPGVAPYTETGARFELEASQFEVLDHRPIEAILGEILAAGATIDCYEPARGA